MAHIIFPVLRLVAFSLQEHPGCPGGFHVNLHVPYAVGHEDGLVPVVRQAGPQYFRVEDGGAQGHQPGKHVGTLQSATIGHRPALRKAQQSYLAPGSVKLLKSFLEKVLKQGLGLFPRGLNLLGAGNILPGHPAISGVAAAEVKGQRRVGADIYVAPVFDGGRQAGQVPHVGAKSVQHNHQGVAYRGVVIVGEHRQERQAPTVVSFGFHANSSLSG